MTALSPFPWRRVVSIRVDAATYATAASRVAAWAAKGESRYVCAANVHMVMEAYDSPSFAEIVNGADLVVPDGMPLVAGMRILGIPDQERVYGPTLTLHVAEAAAVQGIPVALYGGTEESLADFASFLRARFPDIRVVCAIAPPFRPLSAEEDDLFTAQIAGSGAGVVFVGIGCPKQEKWMAAHRGKIPAVMLGVGAAFDFHSGRVRQAPAALQKAGLEWLFRLCMEPRRLWRRYALHNPRFLALFLVQVLRGKT